MAVLEALLRRITTPDLVFVPSFCQWDIPGAHRFCQIRKRPLMVDPLISLYDTRIFERRALAFGSRQAARLYRREKSCHAKADLLLVDTAAHGDCFIEEFDLDASQVHVVQVSAEESLFTPNKASGERSQGNGRVQVLFYGSFIPPQGVEMITEAIRLYQGPDVSWHLLGGDRSASKDACVRSTADIDHVIFEKRIPYERLPQRIGEADILLGIFGNTAKTTRVIPNKVYQAMACGKPVVSSIGPYPDALLQGDDGGIEWVPAGDPQALVDAVARLAANPDLLYSRGIKARQTYARHFSNRQVVRELAHTLEGFDQKALIR
ncbi:MAG: glycosyltransferase [Gammaproteobacteria bacterium]|nr:glycosyltransferase [Gammaproteobacteria bacterium]